MGILNVTPDSFSDGGEFFSFDDAVAHGKKMAVNGADIIDVGGESTRPFSAPVTEKEEISRVIPVIENLSREISIPVSIDTTKAEVARQAIKAGASIINDISSFRFNPEMADVAAEYEVPVILMHMKGTPETMQVSPVYGNIVKEIKTFFNDAVVNAERKGVSRSKIIIDPGIGFGKTVQHNLILIRHLHEFKSLDLPVLIGLSRKRFIRNILGKNNDKDINPTVSEIETGTQAAVASAILSGAHIIRVHDVKNTAATVKIIDAIKAADPSLIFRDII